MIMDRATGPRRGTIEARDHADAHMSQLGLLKRRHGGAAPPTSVFWVPQVHRAPLGVIIHQIESVRSERPCMLTGRGAHQRARCTWQKRSRRFEGMFI